MQGFALWSTDPMQGRSPCNSRNNSGHWLFPRRPKEARQPIHCFFVIFRLRSPAETDIKNQQRGIGFMNPRCSIVIRCYNEEKYIGKLLHGIMQQTEKVVETVIVDSGSTDGTLKIASTFPVKIVQIAPEEFSFGRSLNIGCEEARGDYIVIASAHVYPLYKSWLSELLKPFENSKIGLVYGRQIGGRETRFSESQIFLKWYPPVSADFQNHPFCNNANAAIRRSLWESYRYNEELTGLEDIDWANRLIKDGYRISYHADATVAHIHNEKPLQTFNRYRREAIALKKIFPDEKFYLWDFARLYLTNVFSDYNQAAASKHIIDCWLDILRFRLMQFWGTYRGFKDSDHVSERLKKTLYYPNTIEGHKQDYSCEVPQTNLLVDYSSKDCTYD
jgi:glycosyltransferase involved in cell wall biosynthesis